MPRCDLCGEYIERPRTFIGKNGHEYKVCSQCLLELKEEEQTKGRPEPPQKEKGRGLPDILKQKWWRKNL